MRIEYHIIMTFVSVLVFLGGFYFGKGGLVEDPAILRRRIRRLLKWEE